MKLQSRLKALERKSGNGTTQIPDVIIREIVAPDGSVINRLIQERTPVGWRLLDQGA